MRQYIEMLKHVFNVGRHRGDRTGTGTMSTFGYQARFNLKDGLPVVTGKEIHLPSVIHELLWLIKGDTNIAYLQANGVRIWNEWAAPEDVYVVSPLLPEQMRDAIVAHDPFLKAWANVNIFCPDYLSEKLVKLGLPITQNVKVKSKGDLGPVYGKQWRNVEDTRLITQDEYVAGVYADKYDISKIPVRMAHGEFYVATRKIDQLANAIEILKRDPDSRRILVDSWNPADLDHMALTPCHNLFQFGTTPLNREERWALFNQFAKTSDMAKIRKDIRDNGFDANNIEHTAFDEALKLHGVPTHRLNCMLNIRSNDIFLGAPFNITSYAILTHLVAQVVGMDVGELVYNIGDMHVYNNHVEQVGVQLQREPYPLPTLMLNPTIKNIDDFTIDDIVVTNYKHHPKIKAKVSV